MIKVYYKFLNNYFYFDNKMENDKINKPANNSQNNTNSSNNQIDFTDTQKVVQLMKEQNKELKLSKKKLEKLEEKFIQVNTDLKNIISDKNNIEEFMSNIFPKEMVSQVIKQEYGTYDKSELSKLWLIAESTNQSEYNNVLTKLKTEINELNLKNKELNINYSQISSEFEEFKKNNSESNEKLIKLINENKELTEKFENSLNEKDYLMKTLEEKNKEIQSLSNLELEYAELKAKTLLNSINNEEGNDLNIYNLSLDYNLKDEKENEKSNLNNNTFNNDKKNNNEINLVVKIDKLNMGCQTDNAFYTEEEYQRLIKDIEEYKAQINNLKQVFNDYKEKSHKALLINENNYNKVFREYEKVKKELAQLLDKYNTDNSQIGINGKKAINNLHNIQPASVGINRDELKNFDVNKKISKEYLKNVLLKYLEAIAIGNEFETKILENVLFTVLDVSQKEIKYLENKRITSSFYYHLWYNAKSFLSSKIYGQSQPTIDDEQNNEKNDEIPNDKKENILDKKEKDNN